MKNRKLYLMVLLCLVVNSSFSQNIFEAAKSGDLKRMEYLMGLNKDTIHKKNEHGFTPLILACYRNQPKMVYFLLDHGVDVNYNSQEGTALLGTCYKGNLEIAKMLLEHKADVNAQNEQGTTALIFAVQTNNVELVKLLLKAGAKKEMKEKSGLTALDHAKSNQFTEIMALLAN